MTVVHLHGLRDAAGKGDTPVRHASYLLVSDPAAVQRFEIIEAPEVSDHRALLLEM